MNLMQADRSLAEKLMESEALEILSVLAKGDDPKQASVQKAAQRCLVLAVEYGLIQNNEDGVNGNTMWWSIRGCFFSTCPLWVKM